MYVLNKIKKRIYTSELLGYIKTFKTNKFWKFSSFFWSVYRLHCAVVGVNFSPIGEYTSTVKNRQKWASVHRRVDVKGLRLAPSYHFNTFHEFHRREQALQEFAIMCQEHHSSCRYEYCASEPKTYWYCWHNGRWPDERPTATNYLRREALLIQSK
jgi:hypothetical protein